MKQRFLLKTMLLLCALIAGSTSVWGQTTYKLTQVTSVEANGLYVFEQGGYVMDNSISSSALQTTNSYKTTGLTGKETYIWKLLKQTGNNSGFVMQNVNKSSNKYLVNSSSTGLSWTGTETDGSIWAFNFQNDETVLIQNTGNSNRFLGFTNSTDHAYKAYATGNLSSYPHAIKVYKLVEETSAYTITAASNNTSWGTVSLTGSVITASPTTGYTYADPAYTVTTGTATVVQNGDEFTVTPSSDCTVTINFAAIPTYTVTLGDDNSTLTEATGGAGVTLPTRSAIGAYTFAGWSTTNVATETTEAPTIIPAGAYQPTANITLYPVYTKTEGSGGTQSKTASVTISDYASSNNWVNSTQYETVTLDANVTATANGGANTGKYYSSNESWRLYANESASLTIATSSGELSSVTITYTGNTLTYNNNNVTSGTAIDVSANSVSLSVSGSSSNTQITAISVKYTTTGGGTTYYWSSPVAATVERPEIVVAENPFLFSTTATITCSTSGATIYYTTDGSDPTTSSSVYSTAIPLTATTTIKAFAVVGSDESEVASVTATKNLAETIVTVSGDLTVDLNGETSVDAGTLTATVTYNDAAVPGATVTWSSSNTDRATIDASTGAVTIKAVGDVTFTATYAGNSDYAEATGTKTITIVDNNAPGSKNNPYTVADAIAYINTLGSSTSPIEVYVSGIISQVDSYNSNYHSITYWISDDGTKTTQMQVYSGKGLNDANFSSKDDLAVGDVVTVKGYVKKYNDIPEFDKNNKLVSWNRPATPSIDVDETTVNVTAAGGDGTIEVTYTMIDTDNLYIQFCDAEGEDVDGTPYYPWFDVDFDSNNNLTYTVAANEGEARPAYFRIYGYDNVNSNYVMSDLITVTQAKFVADYATLPFSFNGRSADIGTTSGLTSSGLGSDYNSSTAPTTQLKFDSSGDYLILKINDEPVVLSFDIKGNGFSGGTFKVQISADGETYTDLATYTELGTAETKTFISKTANTRYIKWIYTEKSNGNVGLGNIYVSNELATATTISSTGWSTYCSPVALDFNGLEVEAYIATGVEGTKVVTSALKGTVPANTPLLLKGTAEEEYSIPIVASSTTDVSGNKLKAGTGAAVAKENGVTRYVLSADDDDKAVFKMIDEDPATVPVGKAYLEISGSSAPMLSFYGDGETTGIRPIDNGQLIMDNVIYDLSGRRIENPTKGVYIMNGKKVLVK